MIGYGIEFLIVGLCVINMALRNDCWFVRMPCLCIAVIVS